MARATLKLLLAATLLAEGCGGSSSPASPSSTATGPIGAVAVWVGTIEVTGCSGNYFCTHAPQPFVLRLAGDNSGWLQIDTDDVLNSGGEWSVALSPTLVAGFTILRGSAAGGPMTRASTLDVSLSLKGDPTSATIEYTVSMQSGFGNPRLTSVVTGRVSSARRDATIFPGRFQGDWRGVPARTSCSGDCDLDPLLNSRGTAFSLTQLGAAVTGSNIVATANGDSLTGTIHYLYDGPCHSNFDSAHVCAIDGTFSVTVDAFDQWHGTISYRVSGTDYGGERHFELTAAGTLDGMGRWTF